VAAIDAEGYIQITDRIKDVIKSGGEWISSVELENALMAHPDVMEAAVVAVPDEKWGERPKAFVVLRDGHAATGTELVEHVRTTLARYKAPDSVEFVTELPKTSTGKIQKFQLREREWAGRSGRVQG
jgi:fatty-acyl-CoA synthase